MKTALPFSEGDRGEQALLERLYYRYRTEMYRTAFSVLHTHQDAEDAVQEALMRIAANLSRIACEDSPATRAYVYIIIVRNVAINMARRNSREIPAEFDDEGGALTAGSAESEVLSRIGAQELYSAIQKLPEKYRDVLHLTACEGYSLAEAARCIGISYENAKSRVLRARRRLREILAEQGYQD